MTQCPRKHFIHEIARHTSRKAAPVSDSETLRRMLRLQAGASKDCGQEALAEVVDLRGVFK